MQLLTIQFIVKDIGGGSFGVVALKAQSPPLTKIPSNTIVLKFELPKIPSATSDLSYTM